MPELNAMWMVQTMCQVISQMPGGLILRWDEFIAMYHDDCLWNGEERWRMDNGYGCAWCE